jgi:hypothetical protein
MIQLKFRAWHYREERWLDPWAEEDPMLSLKDFGKGCELYLYDRDTGNWSNKHCMPKDIVVQQWIGLQDVDGKDIYDGDFVTFNKDITDHRDCIWKNWGHIWIWHEPLRVTLSFNHPYSEMSEHLDEFLSRNYTKEHCITMKVIGNICETPDPEHPTD